MGDQQKRDGDADQFSFFVTCGEIFSFSSSRRICGGNFREMAMREDLVVFPSDLRAWP